MASVQEKRSTEKPDLLPGLCHHQRVTEPGVLGDHRAGTSSPTMTSRHLLLPNTASRPAKQQTSQAPPSQGRRTDRPETGGQRDTWERVRVHSKWYCPPQPLCSSPRPDLQAQQVEEQDLHSSQWVTSTRANLQGAVSSLPTFPSRNTPSDFLNVVKEWLRDSEGLHANPYSGM